MKRFRWVGGSFLAALALVTVTSCTPEAGRERPAVADPLAAGWRLACAITNDPGDRAERQEKIALAFLARGDSATALDQGERIENWRRGVVVAEAAATLAEGGRNEAAEARVAQAEALAKGIEGWQKDYILARIVKARALLGHAAAAGRWSDFYRSNRDYRGEVTAYHALALARGGQVTNALAVLDGLADTEHVDVASARTAGYLLLARAGYLDAVQTSNTLVQAWSASQRVGGGKRTDLQLGLVETAAACGQPELGRTWLAGISSNLLAGAETNRGSAVGVCRLAVRWAVLRDADRVAECVRVAEPLIAGQQAIEQPALVAQLGEAWTRLGERPKGRACYEHAMDLACRLTNPRPRAMAGVDVCLSLERAGLSRAEASSGLRRLLAACGAGND